AVVLADGRPLRTVADGPGGGGRDGRQPRRRAARHAGRRDRGGTGPALGVHRRRGRGAPRLGVVGALTPATPSHLPARATAGRARRQSDTKHAPLWPQISLWSQGWEHRPPRIG